MYFPSQILKVYKFSHCLFLDQLSTSEDFKTKGRSEDFKTKISGCDGDSHFGPKNVTYSSLSGYLSSTNPNTQFLSYIAETNPLRSLNST